MLEGFMIGIGLVAALVVSLVLLIAIPAAICIVKDWIQED